MTASPAGFSAACGPAVRYATVDAVRSICTVAGCCVVWSQPVAPERKGCCMPEIVAKLGYVPSALIAVAVFSWLTFWVLNHSGLAPWFSREEVVPPYFSYSAVLFALFAAMVASDIWGRYRDAGAAVVTEAAALTSLLATSRYLDTKDAAAVVVAARNYVEVVVKEEWPAMRDADVSRKDVAHAALTQLSAVALDAIVEKKQPRVVEHGIQQAIDHLRLSRLQRHAFAYEHVSYAKWRALILFGFLTIFSVGVVHARKPRAMMTAIGICSVGIVLTVTVLANNRSPFAGIDPVKPSLILDSIRLFDARNPGP